MAYFDSPKNKAMWEKELSSLKEERQARTNGVLSNKDTLNKEKIMPQNKQEHRNFREKISFKDLLFEETKVSQKVRPERNKSISKPNPSFEVSR